MEVIDINLKNENPDNEALLKKKKFFEDMYNKQLEERENLKKIKQIQDEQTKDPKELMLTIQANFCNLYEGLIIDILNSYFD